MYVHLDRDSVAAGDDVEPHSEDREVDPRRPFERFVHELLHDGYIPSIQGGRATWVARTARRGPAIAVVAVRYGRLDGVRFRGGVSLDVSEIGEAVYLSYEAQRDPGEVFEAIGLE